MFNRPKVLSGNTYKFKFLDGNCFITVNKDCDGNLREVFLRTSGGESHLLEAIGRLTSIILRKDLGHEIIVKHLAHINQDPIVSPLGKGFVKSIPDALAQVLLLEYENKKEKKNESFYS